MDNQNKTPRQSRAERQKYARIQRYIRTGAICLAIVLSILSLAQSCSTKRAIDDLAAQLREKRIAQAQAELQAIQSAQTSQDPAAASAPMGGVSVTLSFVGDCILGVDESFDYEGSFAQYYDRFGASYFFQNVKSIFEGDDLTVANLEGAFTLSENRENKELAFKADPSYAYILAQGGIDAVSVANGHTYDYGDEGYVDTLANLDNARVGRFGYENVLADFIPVTASDAAVTASVQETGGITVGLIGVYQGSYEDYEDMALAHIQTLREEGAQIIIVDIHWDTEYEPIPDDDQIKLAHGLIDAGADLIVGHQLQAMQGIEKYHGKYIAYSLGSFCDGGDAAPGDFDTMIFQQTFTLVNGQCQENAELRLIPCSISSEDGVNNYCPTPASGDAAQRILDKIYSLSDQLDGGIRPESGQAA